MTKDECFDAIITLWTELAENPKKEKRDAVGKIKYVNNCPACDYLADKVHHMEFF